MTVRPADPEPSVGAFMPVDALRQPLAEALAVVGRAVVVAPPGAGKSTRLPLWLMARFSAGVVILLQPRRLAALHVARYLAAELQQPLGETVGVTTRYERYASAATRLEVLTEGVFLRRIQADPLLDGVGLVLFDEFHERNWQCDLALAFALEAQGARARPQDLGLVLMSATVDGEYWADWLRAPLLSCSGRHYPVSIEYSPPGRVAWERHAAAEIIRLLDEGAGRILVFLPGMRWIRELERQLRRSLPELPVWCLHASLPAAHQARALAPPAAPDVVLATNVAQTSLTIAGVDAVVDLGLARRAFFDPGRNSDSLEVAAIAKDAADQRAGRAGRLGPGRCVRLWDREQHGRRPAAELPAIRRVDLTSLALELAAWGGGATLPESPEATRLAAAHEVLRWLGAIDAADRVTPLGSRMVSLGLHPRLARLVVAGQWFQPRSARGGSRSEFPVPPGPEAGDASAASRACLLAALLAEEAQLDSSINLELHWEALWQRRNDTDGAAAGVWRLARRLARRAGARLTSHRQRDDFAVLLFAAFGDRLARRRPGSSQRYLVSSGGELQLPADSGLTGCEWLLVVATAPGRGGQRLRLALPMTPNEVEAVLGDPPWTQELVWDSGRETALVRSTQRYGALLLNERTEPCSASQARPLLARELRQQGLACLRWPARIGEWLERVRWALRSADNDTDSGHCDQQPDDGWNEADLLVDIDQWLLPWVNAVSLSALRKLDPLSLLQARLGPGRSQWLELEAPEYVTLPTGRRRSIGYGGAVPVLRARCQELFGLDRHPVLGSRRLALRLELLSPAGRTIHITQDLPGFWRGAWAEVRKDLRGRYPKHAWPLEPWRPASPATPRGR